MLNFAALFRLVKRFRFGHTDDIKHAFYAKHPLRKDALFRRGAKVKSLIKNSPKINHRRKV